MPATFVLNQPFASYFDASGVVWNIDPQTCVVTPWPAGTGFAFESSDCTGAAFFYTGTAQPSPPRFALPGPEGTVLAAIDTARSTSITTCSVLSADGFCQPFGSPSNPCFPSALVPVTETREVTPPSAPVCVPPLHPELR